MNNLLAIKRKFLIALVKYMFQVLSTIAFHIHCSVYVANVPKFEMIARERDAKNVYFANGPKFELKN